MNRHATHSTQLAQPAGMLARLFGALLGGVAVFGALLLTLVLSYDSYYVGRIYPGVSVAGMDLSGLKPVEAVARLSQRLDYPTRGRILLRDGEKIWLVAPAQIGFYLDPETTALAAHDLGRRGAPLIRVFERFSAWHDGRAVAPRYVFDEEAAYQYLSDLAAQIDLPTVEASLSVSGADVIVRPGQVGRALDVPATLERLQELLQSLRDGEVTLVIHDQPPAILNVNEQATLARQILSAPLTLAVPGASEGDPGPWAFDQPSLGKMLTIQRVASPQGDRYQVGLDAEQLRPFLEDLAPRLARSQQNARFIFNDDTRQLEVIQPAVIGRSLAVEASLQSINQKLLEGEHHVDLEIVVTPPQVGDEVTADQLGIRELVSSHTSYFYGSSGERIQNIQTASARFHGLLVPPGAVFSMGDVLGDVSLDAGYAEALIIFGGRTIKGVGGGVCQVSTTLFRTVFFGGYPVIERYPHAYRVGYYEQTPSGGYNPDLAGLDATVFVPVVDFRFQNDSSNWLLMETYVNAAARTLTWKFYSTSDGRKVEWDTTGPQNVEAPPDPLYEENAELDQGQIKQVDWEAEGADITVTRTVRRDGEVLYQDTFTTHYMPWRAVFQYGPGTEGMPPDSDKKKKKDD
jgi:vancomycin resistance protein YoaR